MSEASLLPDPLLQLKRFVERERFVGYDPYDTLNSPIPFHLLGKWGPILAIQVQKRNPVNIRPLLGIRKQHNPKGIGLLLDSYSRLMAFDPEGCRPIADQLFEWLSANSSSGFSGACWGYNFDWASPEKVVKAGMPSAVVTGFVGRGLWSYYKATNNAQARDMLVSSSKFVIEDLPMTSFPEGVCISYTPIKKDACYNASLLAAEILARAFAVSGDRDLLDRAASAAEYVVSRQHSDGRWNYSLNPESGVERVQIDFHQGFVIDSLRVIQEVGSGAFPVLDESIYNGARFYRTKQFLDDGRAIWRLPKQWPVDIHNQAQGIISFSQLGHLDAEYLRFARVVADWTIRHMQKRDGSFRYRIGRVLRNSIPYMRWGQAWMLLAQTCLLENEQRPQ